MFNKYVVLLHIHIWEMASEFFLCDPGHANSKIGRVIFLAHCSIYFSNNVNFSVAKWSKFVFLLKL